MCLEYDGSSSKHFSSIYKKFRIQNLELLDSKSFYSTIRQKYSILSYVTKQFLFFHFL